MKIFRSVQEKKILSKKYNALLEQIRNISKTHDIINLCAEPTEYSWLGVRNAGLSLFPNNTVEIPQYYSNQLLTDIQLTEIGSLISELNFKQLIFNGFNDYFIQIITAAKNINSKIRVGVIHHGFPAELTGNSISTKLFSSLLLGYEDKKIDKIGFSKYGYSRIIDLFYGKKTFDILYINPLRKIENQYLNRIGVMTSNAFRKNTLTQVLAALSLKNYDIAVSYETELSFLDKKNKIKCLGHLKHEDFLSELSKNIINSHTTFSEASGGQVFTESLALGVPCVTSLTHGYLEDSEELKKALVVDRFDDSFAIAEKMKEIIADRDRLSILGYEYSIEMNKKAEYLLNSFLEG